VGKTISGPLVLPCGGRILEMGPRKLAAQRGTSGKTASVCKGKGMAHSQTKFLGAGENRLVEDGGKRIRQGRRGDC